MKRKKRFSLSTTHLIMLSFLGVIAVGALLLRLPISTKSGESVAFVDALFTATTATCVTGLVTLSTHATWSVFGQIVILLLIQIGGLGLITVMGAISLLLRRKMGLGDRLLLRDAFNLNTLSGLGSFVKRVVLGVERFCAGAANCALQNWGFNFQKAMIGKIVSYKGCNLASAQHNFAGFWVHHKVKISLAIARFNIREAMEFFRQWAKRL